MAQIRNNELIKKIALKIKALREEKGISQEDMYNDTDIHIGRIESARVNITVSTLDRICQYFGVSLGEFFKKL